jgi:uncharacterized RDD family membrane protein YckC
MLCPRCGEVCRCKPKPETDAPENGQWIDPEAYDASEQQFAASLDEASAAPLPRFAVEEGPKPPERPAASAIADSVAGEIDELFEEIQAERNAKAALKESLPPMLGESFALGSQQPSSWRDEVAARLNRYRARRRPREPRYPSLQLKFEPEQDEWTHRGAPQEPSRPPMTRQSLAVDHSPVRQEDVQPGPAETPGRILEFPRTAFAPPQHLDELAEPVMERPRILDVPEVEPPPPALGGILIAPAEKPDEERRPGIEMPLQSAPLWRRLAAGALDGSVVVAALTLSGYIFSRIAIAPPSWERVAVSAAVLGIVFWTGYQYLLLVYSGSTPGLRAARLQLCRFDGSLANRRLRRWRVLASILSAASLGLGYVWCFLDEDRLCWHDRITRTHLAPRV